MPKKAEPTKGHKFVFAPNFVASISCPILTFSDLIYRPLGHLTLAQMRSGFLHLPKNFVVVAAAALPDQADPDSAIRPLLGRWAHYRAI